MSDAPKGARRMADILDHVAHSRIAPSSQQIFEHLALPISSGYDLLNGLAERQFLRRQPTGRWVLGDEIYTLALVRFNLGTIASKIEPTLAALQEQTQATAQLAVRHNNGILITHANKSTSAMSVSGDVGTEVPVNWTAAGRVLASGLGENRLRQVFSASARPSPTGKGVMAFAKFLREARLARQRGYAIEIEQAQVDYCSVAAPVVDARGQCLAAVCLVLPLAQLMDSQETLVSLVSAAAAKLNSRKSRLKKA
jgi:IclR family transcriptional regulator, KDG regulon repressor